ncbi:protein of unknown function DUF488 [Desulfobulbus propionicus DSM 2032]|jgi:uncharacterized protein YeaO (DUF488 family)|uniref:MarR family transcriptional regulator n=1 Tax=Desulfobulbus propionicus (strain ATCC 33891 / DSM 2032 / VKM B-1956 / 1pr3) TaxID=577650 RepID=A0A7U3YLL2_DESPD|nr:DUF488 family protein [Desulfobulbus propionicus]ADW17610.1 protein of unknown function DUF488 [Desulfobulbus propionicus DSM 2032]
MPQAPIDHPKPRITLKRVYDPVGPDDGVRVLVDRVWPRGVGRDKLKADQWLREVAPSDQLRTWFHHDPDKWEEFKARYTAELRAKPEITNLLLELARERGLTLLFAARDIQHNQAVALKEYLLFRANTDTKGEDDASDR